MRDGGLDPMGQRRAPPVMIASLLTAQSDENLGRDAELEPDRVLPVTVLQLDVKDTPAAGEMITVHLRSARKTFEFPNVGVPTPIGTLVFGHGGARSGRLVIDWDQGTQITVPAGSIRLSAEFPEDVVALDTVTVGAFVSRGTRGGGSCCSGPRRTLRSTANSTRSLDIPLGSKVLTVWDTLGPSTRIEWLDHAGILLGSYRVFALRNPPPGPVMVPPTARQVSVVGRHNANLVFGLEG